MYKYEDGKGTFRFDKDGQPEQMSNFIAQIDTETRYVDDKNTKTVYTISGTAWRNKEKIEFPPCEVDTAEFASLGWVNNNWGADAIIFPGQAQKENLKVAIQTKVMPEKKTVYLSTGWQMIDGVMTYLHKGGGITKEGNNPAIVVDLPPSLGPYNLAPQKEYSVNDAVNATLAMAMFLGSEKGSAIPELGWTVLGLTLTPLLGECDFGGWITGRTGTFKSELSSLMMAHYGDKFGPRNLPGNWSSTDNALEAEAYRARNALFAIDDYVPQGTSWQIKSLNQKVDRIARGQGNQAGRSRLNDTANHQGAMYPRGLFFGSGEDTPEGTSLRGRLCILELSPGTISPAMLSRIQKERGKFSTTTAAFVQWLAANPAKLKAALEAVPKVRDKYLTIGHTRTPSMMARMIVTIKTFLNFAVASGAATTAAAKEMAAAAEAAIVATGKKQTAYLEESDPVESFRSAIRTLIASGKGHLRTPSGGVPKKAEQLGYIPQGDDGGGMTVFKASGKRLGWINWPKNELWIDLGPVYGDIKRESQGVIALSQQTMLKRLKDAGYITRIDEARERNTVRVTAEQQTKQVLVLSATDTLETQEIPE